MTGFQPGVRQAPAAAGLRLKWRLDSFCDRKRMTSKPLGAPGRGVWAGRGDGLLRLAALLLLATDASAAAERPPAGRYRCYQPPSYVVTAWFDLDLDGTYRLQGGPPARYAFDPATRVLRWLDGEHAGSGKVGLYVPPAAKDATEHATAQRHAIVMTAPKNLRPPRNDRDPRVQCLLTTH
jgi:hypothetical protein